MIKNGGMGEEQLNLLPESTADGCQTESNCLIFLKTFLEESVASQIVF